jgi:hypothetical protein
MGLNMKSKDEFVSAVVPTGFGKVRVTLINRVMMEVGTQIDGRNCTLSVDGRRVYLLGELMWGTAAVR